MSWRRTRVPVVMKLEWVVVWVMVSSPGFLLICYFYAQLNYSTSFWIQAYAAQALPQCRLCTLTKYTSQAVGAEGGGERMLSEERANIAMWGGDELADCHSERSEESLAD